MGAKAIDKPFETITCNAFEEVLHYYWAKGNVFLTSIVIGDTA